MLTDAVCFVDLLRDSGAFTPEEAEEYIQIGTLNGLFVLGCSIGFIDHHLDQKHLRAPLDLENKKQLLV
jgi:ATP citrate (pro-S)-lyase